MAKSAKQASDTYFKKHQKLLNDVITRYNTERVVQSSNLFATSDYAIFNNIENGVTKHPLRYYQMESLYLLDYLLKCPDTKQEKKELLEEIDKESKVKVPFLSYEMATGSGKTMLMGASIYFLNQKFGIKNFLIITPASTDIYQKTIRNFEVGNYESVWADDTPFTFNLITGDNYSQNLFFDDTKQANIFVFNISKFGTNASNTGKTWENAVWKDENGNSISIKKFLQDKKLIIITDEAHHAQSPVAKKIIHNFLPTATLEFTATAIEAEKGQEKKNQTIVYKYDIKRFLEDGHGKLVRAVALAGETKAKKDEIAQSEKLKLITLFLIHLLKRESIKLDPKSSNIKPISFVKVKQDTVYTQKVFTYIKSGLSSDLENIEIILGKIKQQDLEITGLLTEQYKTQYQSDILRLRQDIQQVADTTIFYHGKSDKETEKKFLNIRKNEVEVVVYMQRLDEGIDLPNIFSMAVINDNNSDFKTSVKQIIGRGVRLNKDKREFDDDSDVLKASSEKLHIVCDQGKNFEEVIVAIQQEFGLNNKYLSFDKEKSTVINRAKSDLLKNKRIPRIKADFKRKPEIDLIGLIKDTDTIVSRFIEDNCFEGEKDIVKRFLKYRPDRFFVEVDVFSDKEIYHKQIQQGGGIPTLLTITDNDTKTIYGRVLKNLPCLPDTETSKVAFRNYVTKFNLIGLQYYRIDDTDDILAFNLFRDAFCNYYRNKIERDYFNLDFREIQAEDTFYLPTYFKDYEIKLPDDLIENKLRLKIKDKAKSIELIDAQVHFYGYEKSIYDYDKFDSYTEFHFADYLDVILKKIAAENKPFWVRNQRNVFFEYGSKKYYPDFLLFKDGMFYIVETKGEVFADHKKNALLKRLEQIPGDEYSKGYKGLLVFSNQMEKMGFDYWDFEKFIAEAENAFTKHQSKATLLSDAPTEDRFIKYLPAYSPEKAYKHFIKNQKTAKPDGWFEVPIIEGNYLETQYMVQVKGNALSPFSEADSWLILNYTTDYSKAAKNVCLVHHNSINDAYDGNCTIRVLEISQSTPPGTLLPVTEIQLHSISKTQPTIIITGVNELSDISIVGIKKTSYE
jgi:superfamily II DNA or RNA helicase